MRSDRSDRQQPRLPPQLFVENEERPPAARRVFVGDTFILNHEGPGCVPAPGAPAGPETVGIGDVVWEPRRLRAALFTSYGVDYGFLWGPALLGAGAPDGVDLRRTNVVVVDNYEVRVVRVEPTYQCSCYHSMVPGASLRSEDHCEHDRLAPAIVRATAAAPYTVVHPRFHGASASCGNRSRFDKGTMHPKVSGEWPTVQLQLYYGR